jgi:small subunit ribosomal protein S20
LPHHKSCIKRLRKSEEQRIRNNALKTILRKTIKDARTQLEKGEQFDLNQAYSRIDLVAGKGVIPKQRASRLKSRLAKAAARITATGN